MLISNVFFFFFSPFINQSTSLLPTVLFNPAFPFLFLSLPSATLIPPFLHLFPCIWLLSSIIISAFRPIATSLSLLYSFLHILFSTSLFPLLLPPLSFLPRYLPEVVSVRGSSGGLKVRGSSSSVQSLLQSYGSSLRKPRSLGRSLSSYLNHTTRLGTHATMFPLHCRHVRCVYLFSLCLFLCVTARTCVFSEIVHEDVKMSSDGESDPPSSDGVQSPVKVRLRNKKISSEVCVHAHMHT